jgi:aspartyl-tRNA(Asn)/glutamyl-tRNA(Gln) amidotransferase subunit A
MTLLEAAGGIKARNVSSVELTRECLAQIARHANLNAFITLTEEQALRCAAERDAEAAAGKLRSPLHGIPVAVKDVFCTQGVRTTCGSKLFENYVPSHDAAVVERLKAAGAVILGKLNQHELAYGITSSNPHFGPVRNPWNQEHVPGGSSGGSGAAIPTGMAYMTMGSDTGGSIRIPAAFCGCVGIKPTTGRVSRYGVLPLDYTLDHMGPLTQTAADAAAVLEVLAGHDPRDDSSSREPVGRYVPEEGATIAGLRIGVPENFYFENLDPGVAAGVGRVIQAAVELGANVVPVAVPNMAEINTVGRVILFCEASAAVSAYWHDRAKFGADILTLFDQGRLIPATDYLAAQRLRRVYQKEFARVWQKADILITPTTPNTAPRIGQTEVELGGAMEDVRLASTRFVRAINVLGLPALSIPCGVAANGLPVAAQLIGPAFSEALLFRAGQTFEQRLGRLTLVPAKG